ncbi:MAG: transcription antitermination factor NusB [Pseudomonadota bacterium]
MSSSPKSHRGRSFARSLAVQAHYQQQLNDSTRAELLEQFRDKREHERVDPEYFTMLVERSMHLLPELTQDIEQHADRELEQLGPVEVAILRVALTELRERIDIPFRVVINEAVDLTHRFGADAAHKYVNAVLDKAAEQHRAIEMRAAKASR